MADTSARNGNLARSRPSRTVGNPSLTPVGNNQYQQLFRRLQALGYVPAGNRRTIGIISSRRKEGVTTVASNLAFQAAGFSGLPVLLVDANHANPCMHRLFKLQQSPGLAEMINRQAVSTDCIHDMSSLPWRSWPAPFRNARRSEHRRSRNIFRFLGSSNEYSVTPPLSVLPAGSGFNGPRPSGESTLDRVAADFDLAVVDLPPVNSATTGGFPISALDGVVFVLESEKTTDRAARRSIQQIKEQGAEILGVAFNKCCRHLPKWIDTRLGD